MTEYTPDPVSDFDASFDEKSLWKDDNGSEGSDAVGVGLVNLCNTCYMISALQVLFCTVPLVTKLKDVTCQNHTSGDFCCLKDLKELFKLCMMSENAVQPWRFVTNLSLISPNLQLGDHEDSHEFLLHFLENIDRYCNDGADTDKQSLVREVFGIRTILQDFCRNCHHLSAICDPMFFLTLPISGVSTLTDALQCYTNVEERVGIECGHCNRFSRVARTMIERAPKVMSFQLNRYNNNMEKDDTAMEYPLELDLRPFIYRPIPDEETKYELYAVINHVGCTTYGGHYLCYVRSSSTIWHEKNDSIVCRVTESEVLNKMPYMLFYVKKGTPWFANLVKSKFTFSPISVLSPASSNAAEETPQKVDSISDKEIHDSPDSKEYDIHEKEIQDCHDSENYDVHDKEIEDYVDSRKFDVDDREIQDCRHSEKYDVHCKEIEDHLDSKKYDVDDREIQDSNDLEKYDVHGKEIEDYLDSKKYDIDDREITDSHGSESYVFHQKTLSTSHVYCDFENCVAYDDYPSTSCGLISLHGNHPKKLNCDSQYPTSTCNDALACQIRPHAIKRKKVDVGHAVGVEHVAGDRNFEHSNKENQRGPRAKVRPKRTANRTTEGILRPAEKVSTVSPSTRNILRGLSCMSQGSSGLKRSLCSSISTRVNKRRKVSELDADPKFNVFSFAGSPNSK